jgi:hypothetical protein
MTTAAVVNSQTNIVENTIIADAATDTPADGMYLIDVPEGVVCSIGYLWNGNEFVPPEITLIEQVKET